MSAKRKEDQAVIDIHSFLGFNIFIVYTPSDMRRSDSQYTLNQNIKYGHNKMYIELDMDLVQSYTWKLTDS